VFLKGRMKFRKEELQAQEWRGNRRAQIEGHRKWWGANGIIMSNANNGKGITNNDTSNQKDCKNTIDDNSTWDTTKGVDVRSTTNDISTWKIVEGVESRS
jgi:hypothetical protein